MNFRRIPFQFTTTDPSERQRELEKRFGVPTRNMYVDSNPGYVTNGMRESSSASSSPRLQHRVPIFVEGSEKPVKPAVDSQNVSDGGRKPHVRVIPIEVEGASPHTARQRTFSGPAGFVKNGLPVRDPNIQEPLSPTKRSMQDLSSPNKVKSPSGPRICNIPIQIEGRSDVRKAKSPVSPQSPLSNSRKKLEASRKPNGSCISKPSNENKVQNEEKQPERNINVPLKRIENILEEFKMYKIGVENFSGTIKDKQYRYLDEMLTRCMLKLDDIDTMGDETVRLSRKAAVKQVQQSIDLLESKVSCVEDSAKEGTVHVDSQRDKNTARNEKLEGDNQKDEEMKEAVEETCNKDVEMTEVVCEESKDEEMKEVAGESSEKDQMKAETSDEVKEEEKDEEMKDGKEGFESQVPEVEMEETDNVCKDEEIKEVATKASEKGEVNDANEVPDFQVPEVEMKESENVTDKLVETESEAMKSQLTSVEPSENSYDTEMEEADAQSKQSIPVSQENASTSQTKCVSQTTCCTDTNSLVNRDTSICKESNSVRNSNTKIETVSQEITEENKLESTVKSTEMKSMHDASKVQSGEQTVSDLPVDEKSERTESSDCDLQNRNAPETSSEKVLKHITLAKKPETEINSEL